tara:strand:+ start:15304 stop:16617 length:1314 start_codon:yes stop_codon:yes gene_type:complete
MVVACGGQGPSAGALGGDCLPENQCNDGLSCREDVCVDEGLRTQVLGETLRDLDVLFVIDNSNSVRDLHTALVANFETFTNVLSTLEGGLPNLHIGVVSTNLGAGTAIAGCEGNGDNGVLQNTARGDCEPPTDRYILDLAESDGGRRTNYQGALVDAFSCIAELGEAGGCGFDQHLESMRRALDGSNSQNQGFLREDAMLAVILLSDKDDCSTEDAVMFGTETSELGPLSTFRCFEFGVACNPDEPREAGVHEDCVVRENSQYMYGTEEYADFLRSLKDPSIPISFSAVAGVGPVVVGNSNGKPTLEASCGLDGGRPAEPAVRIADVAGRMGMPGPFSVCEGVDLTAAAENIVSMLRGQCVANAELAACTFADVRNYGATEEARVQDLPLCDSASSGPCMQLVPNSSNCQDALTEVVIDRRGTAAPENTAVVAFCPR